VVHTPFLEHYLIHFSTLHKRGGASDGQARRVFKRGGGGGGGSTRGLAAIFAHFGTHIVAMEDELLRVKLDAAWVGGKGACWHLVFEAPRYCIRQGVARQH